MIDRIALARERGWTVREIYRAKDAWRKLYARQPSSDITFLEYLDMMQAAGLRPNMVGLRRGQYHFARYNDSGAYTKGNCRFVPQEINQAERKEGYQRRPEFRALMSRISSQHPRSPCPYCRGMFAPGMLAKWHGDNCKQKPKRRTA